MSPMERTFSMLRLAALALPIDANGGGDVVPEGSVDPATGEVRPSCEARQLVTGGATSGTRITPGELPTDLP